VAAAAAALACRLASSSQRVLGPLLQVVVWLLLLPLVVVSLPWVWVGVGLGRGLGCHWMVAWGLLLTAA
jgi:hypothetical protein